MDDQRIGRRKLLAALGTAGMAGISGAIVTSADTVERVVPAEQTRLSKDLDGAAERRESISRRRQDGEMTSEGPERIEAYGAAVDGRTDDTDAVRKAIDAAAPNGTVLFPPGRVRIDGRGRDGIAIRLDQRHRNVTLTGSGVGPGGTTLEMAGGHGSVHAGIAIESTMEPLGVTIADLRFDGNGATQSYRVGHGIRIADGTQLQRVKVDNVLVENCATTGLKIGSAGVHIRNSTFAHNGRRAARDGKLGHGVTSDLEKAGEGRTVAENVLCVGNTGSGFDNGGGKLTVRRSAILDNGYGIKLNDESTETVVEQTRIERTDKQVIYNIPADRNTGPLVLTDVYIESAGWPAFLLPAAGAFRGDGIVVKNTNGDEREHHQPAAVNVQDEGKTFDVGTMSVHGTVGGSALYLENCLGRIDRLVHGGNDGGIGEVGDVDIGSVEENSAIDVPLVDLNAVGAAPQHSPFQQP